MLKKAASKNAFQKIAEAIGDFIGNNVADKVTRVSRTSPRNTLETLESETENAEFR